MKRLPKHLRPRYRYLALEIETSIGVEITRDGFQEAVWESARDLLGDVGSAVTDPIVVRFEYTSGMGRAIVRTHRGEVERTRAGLACIDRFDGEAVGIVVLGVSGTIRGCEGTYSR